MSESGGRPYGPPTSSVELSISCWNLPNRDLISKSDPVCVVWTPSRQGRWTEVARTERIKDNLNPAWHRKFVMEYKPQERQIIRFTVFDMDSTSAKLEYHDFLGSIECSLGEIVAEKKNGFSRNLDKSSGKINILAEELTENKEVVTLNFSARNLDKKDFFGLSDPYLELSRSTSAANTQYVVVHRTEVVKSNLNPDWSEFKMDVRSLCNGDYDRDIKVDVYDWNLDGGHEYIGSFHTNLRNLTKGHGPVNVYDVVNEIKRKKKGRKCKKSGTVILNSILIETQPSFWDLIEGGTRVNLSVAIDFSDSNGDPSHPASLHYRDPTGKPNHYVTAIKSVAGILQDYTNNKMFSGLGFSARLPPSGEVSQEFFLTLNPELPQCSGVEGVLAAYHFTRENVQPAGPTHFSPVINHAARLARAHINDKNAYFILLIITNGLIKDLEAAKQAVVAASVLPLSIVIVGVGNEDFTAMHKLDSDDKLLRRGSHVAKRDIVQFVELRRFIQGGHCFSRDLLAKEVLEEIPDQITGYMKMKGYKY